MASNTPDFGKDEYETPSYVLDMVLDELDASKWFVWEPFPGSGFSTNYMRSKGFEVTNGSFDDFFQHRQAPKVLCEVKQLVVITNPPYSKKKEILEKLKELGVRKLALFIPMGTVVCRYFKDLFPDHHKQVIIHTRCCRFLHPKTHEYWHLRAPFDVIWITSGLGLKYDVQYKEKPKALAL